MGLKLERAVYSAADIFFFYMYKESFYEVNVLREFE